MFNTGVSCKWYSMIIVKKSRKNKPLDIQPFDEIIATPTGELLNWKVCKKQTNKIKLVQIRAYSKIFFFLTWNV